MHSRATRCPKWLAAALLAAALAAGCRRPPPPATTAAPTPAATRTLTVAFWNLEWFPGHYPHANAARQAAHVAAVVPVAERLDPDVLGLEEIADRDAAGLVAAHLKGFKVDVCSEFLRGPEPKRSHRTTKTANGDGTPAPEEIPPDDGAPWTNPDHQQVALCSRLPILATGAQAWQPDAAGRRQRRGFVWAVYRTAPGEALLVYGLHLKSNVLDEPGGQPANVLLREEAARQWLAHERATAAAWARTDRLRLVIVGGDLNTSLDDPQFEAEQTVRVPLGEGGFRWLWAGVPLARRLTLPAKGRYASTCFDHVLYRPADDSVRLADAAIGESGSDASDHRPVVARFSW